MSIFGFRYVNLTKHVIRLANERGVVMQEIQPSGIVALVTEVVSPVFEINGTQVVATNFGQLSFARMTPPPPELSPDILGTPPAGRVGTNDDLWAPQTPGVIYLASLLVMQAARRVDIWAPDTGDTAIRDSSNSVYAVTRLRAPLYSGALVEEVKRLVYKHA